MSVVRIGLQLLGLWTLAACAAATVIGAIQYRRQNAAEREAVALAELVQARTRDYLMDLDVWLAGVGVDEEWAEMNGEGE